VLALLKLFGYCTDVQLEMTLQNKCGRIIDWFSDITEDNITEDN